MPIPSKNSDMEKSWIPPFELLVSDANAVMAVFIEFSISVISPMSDAL